MLRVLAMQGVFGVKEPCSCVHAWVAQALRFPGSYFELIAPSRQPLPMGGTSIRDVPDIVPSAVLNFRYACLAHVCVCVCARMHLHWSFLLVLFLPNQSPETTQYSEVQPMQRLKTQVGFVLAQRAIA
eukprot:781061-Pelagomonas_calceolata.AAC.2